MKIKQIINYIRKPNQDKLEELLLSVNKKDAPFFKLYIQNCLIENKGFQPLKQLNRLNNYTIKSPNSRVYSNIYRIIYHPHTLIIAYSQK